MFSTWIGIVLLFAFFGLLALVVIGASPRGDTYEEKRAKARAEKLQALCAETSKALTTYAWVDKTKGVVRIPITEAMKLTVTELSRKTPVAANPISTPAASPSAQNASSSPASSAPSSSPSSGTPKPSASITPTASPPVAGTKPAVPSSSFASPSPSVAASPSPVRKNT